MAGKLKHMERSHRSNGVNKAVFNSFESRAVKTFAEMFKSLFHRKQNK